MQVEVAGIELPIHQMHAATVGVNLNHGQQAFPVEQRSQRESGQPTLPQRSHVQHNHDDNREETPNGQPADRAGSINRGMASTSTIVVAKLMTFERQNVDVDCNPTNV